jgi:hypothetical protein
VCPPSQHTPWALFTDSQLGGQGRGDRGLSPPSLVPWGQGKGVPLVARSFLSLGGPRRGELLSSESGWPGGGCRLRGGVLAGRFWAPFFSSVKEEEILCGLQDCSSYQSVFFSVLKFELRTYTLSHSISPFFDVFFEIGSLKLFAQAGFKV